MSEDASIARFDERVVVITGAARGLGRDYAKYFARDGANVVLVDVNDTTSAAKDASDAGPVCIGIEADVTDRRRVDAMVERCRAEFGRIDILINNAGLWRGLAEAGLLHAPDALWDAAWSVNVAGTLRCYQAAVPLMVERGWGRVVNISSMASRSGADVYGLTKHAIEHMTTGMAAEVGARGITVNCVAPGIAAFEAAQRSLPDAEAVVARNAIARLGTSRDLYSAMCYLCSDDAAWVTGQTLRVDGGAPGGG